MPIYKVDENLNEGALSLALAAGITAAVIGAATYSCVKHIKETKELDYILEHYAEYHDDAIDYDDLTCKNYYIKPFSLKLQKGKPMKNTKFLGITKNHIASFTYKNKPFMTCAYIDNSVSIGGTTVINIQVKCEFHDPIAKKHKEYYISSFCRKRRLFIKNNSKWIKEEYKKLKENENLNEGAIGLGVISLAVLTGLALHKENKKNKKDKKETKKLYNSGLTLDEIKKNMNNEVYRKYIDKINRIETDPRLIPLIDKTFKSIKEYANYNNAIANQIIDNFRKQTPVDDFKDSIYTKFEQLKKKINYSDIEKEFNKIKDDLHFEEQDASYIKKWLNFNAFKNYLSWDDIEGLLFTYYFDEINPTDDPDNPDEFYDNKLCGEYLKAFKDIVYKIDDKLTPPIINQMLGKVKVYIKK